MKKLFLGILAASLLACSPPADKPDSVGGKKFKEFKVFVFEHKHALNAYLRSKKLVHDSQQREGFSGWNKQMDVCYIFVVKPNLDVIESQSITWGHELKHCVYGEYH